MRKNVIFVVSILFNVPSSAQDDFYSCGNLFAFAENLFSTGDYDRAIGEYLRASVRCEDDNLRDSLWYRISVAYLNLSRPSDARRYIDRVALTKSDSLPRAKSLCLRAFSYYLEHKYDSVFIPQSLTVNDPAWQQRMYQIKIASFLKQYHWQEAAHEPLPSPADSLSLFLNALARQGTSMELKSPLAAGLFSAIVPGTGKLYAQRGWDGLYSLVIIGTMAWQSYEGYRKDGPLSIRCLLFGGLCGVFYSGNIYGSIIAARNYNDSKRAALSDRITLWFTW